MLKFPNDNTTVITTFEDFILTVYVIIDEKNYRHLFPNLCSRGHFNRTRRAFLQTTERQYQKMISCHNCSPVLVLIMIIY